MPNAAAQLECSVCLEPYDSHEHVPRILPCRGAHDVCSACIDELAPNGEAFACPQCRDDIPSGARINENRLLLQALRQQNHTAQAAKLQPAARRASKKPRRRAAGQQANVSVRHKQLLGALGIALLSLLAIWVWKLLPAPLPYDADLEPSKLWSDALVAMAAGQNDTAAWMMLIALFLDWSYNDGRYLPDVFRAVSNCQRCGIWAEPLRTLVATGTLDSHTRFERTYDSLAAVLVSRQSSYLWQESHSLSSAPLAGNEDRVAFATACAAVFYARDLSTAFIRASSRIGEGGSHHRRALKLGRMAQSHVTLAATHLQPERYLTLMFELAYSHRQIHAMAEGTRWSERFQAAAPTRPNMHWQFYLERDRGGERIAREATAMAQSGMTLNEKVERMVETAERFDDRHIDKESRRALRRLAADRGIP